ncbi:MAG TPA: hypothetical protein VNU71_06450 [Burkholderiaceae bacterium]|nr:hypothetical protein [Burkholderiaceae bacterium]
MKNKSIRWGWAAGVALAAAILAGCGGGGGDSGGGGTTPPVTSTSSFDVSTAYRARTQAGATENYNYTATNGGVTCTGTSTFVFSPTASATFDGATVLASTQTVTSATPTPGCELGSGTGTNYYNTNFVPVGLSVNPGLPSEQYGVLASAGTLPSAAKVGDTGTISTLNVYSNSAKTTKTGSRTVTYAIEADTATTSLVNVITKSYDNSATPQLLSTEQKRYRMTAGAATLTLVSDDVQFATTSTIHIVYTPH